MSGVELKLTAYRERRPPGLELIPLSSTKSSLALADARSTTSPATRALKMRARATRRSPTLKTPARRSRTPSKSRCLAAAARFLSLAAQILGLILRLIRTAHSVSYFARIDPGGCNSAHWVPRQPVFKTSECYRWGVRYDTAEAVEQRHKDACSPRRLGTQPLYAGSSFIASVACATLRLSTPSRGYSPRLSASKVESRGARQVDELLDERLNKSVDQTGTPSY